VNGSLDAYVAVRSATDSHHRRGHWPVRNRRDDSQRVARGDSARLSPTLHLPCRLEELGLVGEVDGIEISG